MSLADGRTDGVFHDPGQRAGGTAENRGGSGMVQFQEQPGKQRRLPTGLRRPMIWRPPRNGQLNTEAAGPASPTPPLILDGYLYVGVGDQVLKLDKGDRRKGCGKRRDGRKCGICHEPDSLRGRQAVCTGGKRRNPGAGL